MAYERVEASKAALAKFDAMKRDLYHSNELQKYEASDESPFYEDDGKWNVSDGEYVVDYHINRERSRAEFQGLWRIRSHDPFHKVSTRSRSRLILCDKVQDFKGLRLNSSEANRLGKSVFDYVSSRDFQEDGNGNMLDITLNGAIDILSLDKGLLG